MAQRGRSASLLSRLRDELAVMPWKLDPRVRRCPQCKLTWESPRLMKAQGGVCHDCMSWDEPIVFHDVPAPEGRR